MQYQELYNGDNKPDFLRWMQKLNRGERGHEQGHKRKFESEGIEASLARKGREENLVKRVGLPMALLYRLCGYRVVADLAEEALVEALAQAGFSPTTRVVSALSMS